MVLKLKPKTAVLRWNRTATKPRFSGGHVMLFLEFQKWPSPVTNVRKQQLNYCLSRIPASTVWSDRLTNQSGVARQHNYLLWHVDLCAAVGAIRTDVVHTGVMCTKVTRSMFVGLGELLFEQNVWSNVFHFVGLDHK